MGSAKDLCKVTVVTPPRELALHLWQRFDTRYWDWLAKRNRVGANLSGLVPSRDWRDPLPDSMLIR